MWLLFEIWSLYVFVLAAIFYNALETILMSWFQDTPKEKKRSLRDFVNYSIRSINWYAFNFVLIVNPIIFMIICKDIDDSSTKGLNYNYVMIVLSIIHSV